MTGFVGLLGYGEVWVSIDQIIAIENTGAGCNVMLQGGAVFPSKESSKELALRVARWAPVDE